VSHRAELLRAFRIGPEDLAANRENRLGSGQVRRLRRNIWISVLAVATPVQLAIVVIAALTASSSAVSYAVWAVLFGLWTLLEVVWVRDIGRVLRDGTVKCLQGPVTVHSGGRGGTWITVAGERNRLWTGYWHVGRGMPYRVYVAPAAKLIVAMEPDGWD